MNKLEVKIPWWYKPFIHFMPDFYDSVPPFRDGIAWTGAATLVGTFVGARGWKMGKTWNDNHRAYLDARWKALWIDFWSRGSQDGVNWCVFKGGSEPRDLSTF